jgi:hypothetical protein
MQIPEGGTCGIAILPMGGSATVAWTKEGAPMRKIALVLISLLVACSSELSKTSTSQVSPGAASTPGTPNDKTGTIALRLSLGGDTQIDSVDYVLQTGASVVQSGTLTTRNGNGVTTQLGSIPAGAGYSLVLSATSPDGGVGCLGTSGAFSVQPHALVTQQVQLTCTATEDDSGIVVAELAASFCGTWQSVSTIGPGIDAEPTNGSLANADGVTPIVITATANGPDTAALVYSWSVLSATGGGVTLGQETGDGTTTSTQTVTCNPSTQDGTAVLQLTVTDSDDGGVVDCPSDLSTTTISVECSGVPSAATTDGGEAGSGSN